MHRVQQREIDEKMGNSSAQSLVEDVTNWNNGNKKVTIETISSTENVLREPEYRLYKKKEGKNYLIGEFKFPDVISAKELTLDVGEDRILLESKNRGYLLDIFVPYIVKQKACTSSFDRAAKILTVTMPLVGG
ncbi:hypothetical protein NQ317_004321 [Molorchus minor]|uniref:PIH1D1/2/3 CS-like domain-containing protein n=1 Tax=Molorchus minor TaxID=1323400 RepID=A0ABQ9JX30_9CUCU|nr:hypothetical protein NQ317_004321 [Molorchus minor]